MKTPSKQDISMLNVVHEDMTFEIVLACVRASMRAGQTHCFVPTWTAWPEAAGAVPSEECPSRLQGRALLNHAAEGRRLYDRMAKVGIHAVPVSSDRQVYPDDYWRFETLISIRNPMRSGREVDGVYLTWDADTAAKFLAS